MCEDELGKALAEFAGDDARRAEQAFGRLRVRSERVIASSLRGSGWSADTLEDVVQETFIRIWRSRPSFRNQGAAAWFSYLHTVAGRVALDRWRRGRGERANVNIDLIPDDQIPIAMDVLIAVEQRHTMESLLRAADVLWLKLDDALPRETHTRQTLAAQLHYLDGVPVEEILDLIPPDVAGGVPLTREQLDTWLCSEGVIRALAFEELYYPPDRLAWHLLGLNEPVCEKDLTALTSQVSAWTASDGGELPSLTPEVMVVIWRYRLGKRPEQILALKRIPCDASEMSALIERLALRFPFNKKMAMLMSALARELGPLETRRILGAPGLWQRLAFQYEYVDDLPQPDICERLVDAARQARYEVKPDNINVWLSGRRLIKQLINYWKSRRSGADD